MSEAIMVYVDLSEFPEHEAKAKAKLLDGLAFICKEIDSRYYRVTWNLDAAIEDAIGIPSDCITPYIP